MHKLFCFTGGKQYALTPIVGSIEAVSMATGIVDGGVSGCTGAMKVCPSEITINGSAADKTMTYTDDLKAGDVVILIPSTDEQRYYLVDKAVVL